MIAAVILSAGESKRMGTPKALLDFDGKLCLSLMIEKCKEANIDFTYVILGHAQDEIKKKVDLKNVKVIINEDYVKGQTSSLKIAVKNLGRECESFLLFPVDLPNVRVSSIKMVIDGWRASKKEIAVPVFNRKRGHPPIFSRKIFSEFINLKDSEPAHTILRRDPKRVFEVEVDDAGVLMKMNTPQEYKIALETYRCLNAEKDI